MSITITNSKVSYGSSIVTDELVGYWDAANPDSYPGSGTIWYDLSDYKSNGVLINGPTYENNCLVFGGTNSLIDCTTIDSLTHPTTLSISSWFNMTGGDGSYRCILHSGPDGSVGGSRYWIGISAANYLVATIGGYVNGWAAGQTTTIGTLNTWWNMAATYDGTNVKVYINGKYNKQYGLASFDGAGPTKMGAASILGTTYHITGKISNTKIYHNKVLTDLEILQNYNSTKSRFGY